VLHGATCKSEGGDIIEWEEDNNVLNQLDWEGLEMRLHLGLWACRRQFSKVVVTR
jgi:hypothetical protein